MSVMTKRAIGLFAACAIGWTLTACKGPATTEADTKADGDAAAAATDAPWREFANADGTTTEIPAQPKRILSTSVAITGTLLAIDAPVVASGSSAKNVFFAQWADVAAQRGVENAWPAGSVNLEAAYAVKPDLIVVSTSGADSAMPQLAELKKIAPTIVLDYGDQTWQDLAIELGRATGNETQAQALIAKFDQHVAETKAKIHVPAGSANIISYNGPGTTNPIATGESAHGRLLTALGFTLEEPDPSWQTQAGPRKDFIWAQYENLTRLTSPTTFLLSVDDDGTRKFLDDPVLANLASVKAKQVHGLGKDSFRIDYFSATEVVDGIAGKFAQ